MIQKFDRQTRRILTFPAVQPCSGIAPATLLSSLITISRTICGYKSKFFATQKRNSREIIRQIEILLMFFDEIREYPGSKLGDSLILCLSELHVAFQKIHFLLEDCSRQGGRIWVLMKAEFVAAQFRELIRAVATALDVLPLNSIDVGSETKELVGLVAKHSRSAKFELHVFDEMSVRDVFSVIDRFEGGMTPNSSVLKRVLEYLNIGSWGDCNKEIRFLEDEMCLDCSSYNERDAQLMNSLIGFLSYCRGVVFDSLDHPNTEEKSSCGGGGGEVVNVLNSEDFLCPISLELMVDPVTVSTGQTYDRSSIQKWLKSGNLVCPKTGETLKNAELIPNSTLQKLIQQFCFENHISISKTQKQNHDIAGTVVAGSPAAAGAMKLLSRFLARILNSGSEGEKNKAAYEIRLLSKSSIFNRSCLVKAGTILPLLKLLTATNATLQENTIAALLKLSKHPKGKKAIVANGGLKLVLNVLSKGLKVEIRQIAAAMIFYLSSVDEYRELIGETPEAIPGLVKLLKDGTDNGKKNSLVAIFGLLLSSKNHQWVLEANIIPLLIDLLNTSDKDELIAHSLAVLASLSVNFDGSIAIFQASGLPLVLRLLNTSTSRTIREYSVSILVSLCNNCGFEAIRILSKDSTLIGSLYSLLDNGTSRGGKKARFLIQVLHKFHETNAFPNVR